MSGMHCEMDEGDKARVDFDKVKSSTKPRTKLIASPLLYQTIIQNGGLINSIKNNALEVNMDFKLH